MITVTKSNGYFVALRKEDILSVDDQGEHKSQTWITMRDGHNYCVRETVLEVVQKING